MKKVLKYLLVFVILLGIGLLGLIGYVFVFLPGIPLEEVKIEYTHERIKRGEYLARNVAQCLGCHSERDWSRFAGPTKPGTEGKGGEPFDRSSGLPGSFPAANLTPHNLKDWSDAELFRAIVSGVGKDGRSLFPIMPYPNYGKMDREDIYSIIAYIRGLPPIQNDVPEASVSFPMNIIIRTIPSEPEFSNRPSPSDKVSYGKYLVTAASCLECHTPAVRGRINEELAYSGGRLMQSPFGSVASSNITPDKTTGIGAWTEEAFIERFKAYDPENENYNDKVGEDGFNSPMPWQGYAGMKEEDLAAIYAYLMSMKPIRNKVSRALIKNQ